MPATIILKKDRKVGFKKKKCYQILCRIAACLTEHILYEAGHSDYTQESLNKRCFREEERSSWREHNPGFHFPFRKMTQQGSKVSKNPGQMHLNSGWPQTFPSEWPHLFPKLRVLMLPMKLATWSFCSAELNHSCLDQQFHTANLFSCKSASK